MAPPACPAGTPCNAKRRGRNLIISLVFALPQENREKHSKCLSFLRSKGLLVCLFATHIPWDHPLPSSIVHQIPSLPRLSETGKTAEGQRSLRPGPGRGTQAAQGALPASAVQLQWLWVFSVLGWQSDGIEGVVHFFIRVHVHETKLRDGFLWGLRHFSFLTFKPPWKTWLNCWDLSPTTATRLAKDLCWR